MTRRFGALLCALALALTLAGCWAADEPDEEDSAFWQEESSGAENTQDTPITAFALPYLQSGKLFALRFNQMIPKRNFLLVTPSGGHMSPAAENLLHLIYERNENIYD